MGKMKINEGTRGEHSHYRSQGSRNGFVFEVSIREEWRVNGK